MCVGASKCLKLHLHVHSECECICDVVKKLLFVKRLVFSGQQVSQGGELSTWLICAAGTRHKQRRPLMSNVTALISFQSGPGITAGVRERHTSLLLRIRNPGDSAILKSTGFILMESVVSCHYCFVLSCMLILGILGSICFKKTIFQLHRDIGFVCLLISHTAAPFKLG